MRYEFSDDERTAIKPMFAEQAARRLAGKWPPRARWHLLGPAFRRAMARPASDRWSPHDFL